MRLATLLTLVCLSSVGCDNLAGPSADEGADGITLLPAENTYTQGDTAEARLANAAGTPIGYNMCLAMWERWTGTRWERIVPLRMCDRGIYTLPSGEQALLRETVEESWSAGTYRFALTVWLLESEDQAEIISVPFTVSE